MSESRPVDRILEILKKCAPYPISLHYLSIFLGESQPRLQGFLKYLMDKGLVTRSMVPVDSHRGLSMAYVYSVTDKAFNYTIKKKVKGEKCRVWEKLGF